MARLERIVSVNISLNTIGISTLGFSTLLIAGPHAHSLNRVETYTDADDMLADGFTASDELYLFAVDAFAQTPRPAQVKIGRQLVKSVNVTAKEVTTTGKYKVTVKTKDSDGIVTATPYEYTNNGGTAAAIATGIKALIDADANAEVTATVSSDVLTIQAAQTGKSFVVQVSANMSMANNAVTEDIPTMMAAITAEDNDWYGWTMTSRDQADIIAAAEWTEAHIKLFGTSVAEEGALDASVSTDTLSKLQEAGYYRTFGFYHAKATTESIEAALMARCFSILPGGETWANKKLSSITRDNITETQYNAVKGKDGNTYEKFRNIAITQRGRVAGGEWIDIIRFRDWLQEEITVNVFNALVNNDKVPYTDEGIAIIENQIRAALDLGTKRGGIAPDEYDENGDINRGYVIEVPLASTISDNQKASRILDDVKFTARVAGAIHMTKIYGNLTYENLMVGGYGA